MGSSDHLAQKPQIGLVLAAPRGFCAGVERLGAVFVREPDEIPDDSTVTFLAHGAAGRRTSRILAAKVV